MGKPKKTADEVRRRRAYEHIRKLLDAIEDYADSEGIAVFIDSVHYADGPSAHFDPEDEDYSPLQVEQARSLLNYRMHRLMMFNHIWGVKEKT